MRDALRLIAPSAVGLTVCLGVAGLLGHHHVHGLTHGALLVTTAALAAAVLTLAGVTVAHDLWRHHRLAAALHARTRPSVRGGIAVREGHLGEVAFVAGLRRPTIHVDPDLLDRLSPEQQRAVLLHERAHQLAHDPWRAQVAASLRRWSPRARAGGVDRRQARREIAADRAALSLGASRAALAGALLAVPPAHHRGVAAFPPAAELRVRALLGEPVDLRPRPVGPVVAAVSAALAVATCAVVWHPALAW